MRGVKLIAEAWDAAGVSPFVFDKRPRSNHCNHHSNARVQPVARNLIRRGE